jgi:hypothetical protein
MVKVKQLAAGRLVGARCLRALFAQGLGRSPLIDLFSNDAQFTPNEAQPQSVGQASGLPVGGVSDPVVENLADGPLGLRSKDGCVVSRPGLNCGSGEEKDTASRGAQGTARPTFPWQRQALSILRRFRMATAIAGQSFPSLLHGQGLGRSAGFLLTGALVHLIAACAPSQAQAQSARGPLRVHPENPRYFTDGTKTAAGQEKAV